MKKKRIAQTCDPGINKIASGNVTKLKPGPLVATSEISTCMVCAKNPRIENTASPA